VYTDIKQGNRPSWKITKWNKFEHNLVAVSIDLRVWEVRDPVGEDGGVSALQQNGEPGDEVPAGLGLLLAGVPGQGGRQLPRLGQRHLVHPPEGLEGEGHEGDALLPAGHLRTQHPPPVGDPEAGPAG
jgi:hypothetical protein